MSVRVWPVGEKEILPKVFQSQKFSGWRARNAGSLYCEQFERNLRTMNGRTKIRGCTCKYANLPAFSIIVAAFTLMRRNLEETVSYDETGFSFSTLSLKISGSFYSHGR